MNEFISRMSYNYLYILINKKLNNVIKLHLNLSVFVFMYLNKTVSRAHTKSKSFFSKISKCIKDYNIGRLALVVNQHHYQVQWVEKYEPVCAEPCCEEWSIV